MKLNLKIHKLTSLYFILLLPLFEPTCFVDVSEGVYTVINSIYRYSYFIVALVIILRFFTIQRLPSLMFWMMLCFEIIIMISSYLAGDTVKAIIWYFVNDLQLLIFILCAEYAINKNEFRYFTVALASLLTLIIVINAFTVYAYPEGLYSSSIRLHWNQHWFLGYKNVQLPFFAIALLTTGIEQFYAKSWKLVIVMVSIAVTIIGLQSATSMLAIMISFVFFVYVYNKRGEVGWFLMPMTLFVISVFVSFFIVTGMIPDIFSSFLALFGKDLTFTGRITLWPIVIEAFLSSPLIGNGNSVEKLYNLIGYGQSHNFYLDILYRGGLVYFGWLCVILRTAFKNLEKVNGSILYCAIMASILLFFVFFQQEGNHGRTIFLMLVYLAYLAPQIKEHNTSISKFHIGF